MSVRNDPDRSRLTLWAAVFVAFACVAILASSGWREWESRGTELVNAEVEMANLARSLTQHVDDTFELADSLLLGVVIRLETDGIGPQAVERIQKFIKARKPPGRIRAMFIYDENGRWLATTENVDFSALNNSDRDYFKEHRGSADKSTLIGRPIKSRSGGQWIITASRRFNHADGSFAGVVLASIDVSYFSGFYSQFDVGPNGAISLLNADGIMLARSGDNGVLVGRDFSGSPLFKDLAARPAASTYYFKSTIDGTERLSYYRTSDHYPVMLVATRAKDEVLAGWRHDAMLRMAVIFALTAIIGVIGFYLVRQLFLGQRMAAALQAKEAGFRLLAEQSSDVVMRVGLDERIQYVSPSCTRVLGWDAAKLLGTPALGGINEKDRLHVEQTIAALKDGHADEARISYRTRHRTKSEIWMETALRVTRSPDSGEVDGVVAISRDMTEHKNLEGKLAALATVDSLTGLANRRQFDDRLTEEWARAKRDGTPLSLLIVDVDHFKSFNDQYGHQAGDDCLRVVAQTLAGQLRRPADLAARYGGEEFVVLMPNTSVEGCERVGESIRQALRERALLHGQNPCGLVTISLGGATHTPEDNLINATSFVEAADRALYTAKAAGRDRLLMSARVIAWSSAKSA